MNKSGSYYSDSPLLYLCDKPLTEEGEISSETGEISLATIKLLRVGLWDTRIEPTHIWMQQRAH